jgi:hypothetical protein
MANQSWAVRPGLSNVGSYQVSGKPYATGSVLVHASGSALRVTFPSVTKWVKVIPHEGHTPVRISFSENGMHAGNHFHVLASSVTGSQGSEVLDLKVGEIWLMSTTAQVPKVDILAGLTSIPARSVETADGPSWKGTDGVG